MPRAGLPVLKAGKVASGILLAVLAGGLAAAGCVKARAAAAERLRMQGHWFDRCLSLIVDIDKQIAPHGFARIAGRYNGLAVDLQALPDALAVRKLPVLWLLVSLPVPLPVGATISILRRPSGTETFSPHGRLEFDLTPPPGFPAQTALRTDDPQGLPDPHLLQAQAGLFADDHVKELVISPKGVRIVRMADEADRGRYLLYRDAELGRTALAPEVLEPLLQHLAALVSELGQTQTRKD